MKIKLLFLVSILTLFYSSGFAQTETNITKIKRIYGSVKSLNNDVSNVLIINLNSKKSTITDSLGLFIIEAKLNDSIQFTAVQYLMKEIIITDAIFLKNLVTVNLVENVINLNEVTVTPYNLTGKIEQDVNRLNIESIITSSTLGLPNADIKVLTQSERLLLVADKGKYARFMTIEEKMKHKNLLGFLTVGVMINPDKIINLVSGKTKVLEDKIARDKKMAMEKKIIARFSKKVMSKNFNIPEQNIDGFLTFCLSQTDFLELVSEDNTVEIWEYLKRKSIEFKE